MNWTTFIGNLILYSRPHALSLFLCMTGIVKLKTLISYRFRSQKVSWPGTFRGHLHVSATGTIDIGHEIGERNIRIEIQAFSAKQHERNECIPWMPLCTMKVLDFIVLFVFSFFLFCTF